MAIATGVNIYGAGLVNVDRGDDWHLDTLMRKLSQLFPVLLGLKDWGELHASDQTVKACSSTVAAKSCGRSRCVRGVRAASTAWLIRRRRGKVIRPSCGHDPRGR